MSYDGTIKDYTPILSGDQDELPKEWVRTMRPCMKCGASYTWIDKDGVWHCQYCGWRSDEMGKSFTKEEFKTIKNMYESGALIKDIATKLQRKKSSIGSAIFRLREQGDITTSPRPRGRVKQEEAAAVLIEQVIVDPKEVEESPVVPKESIIVSDYLDENAQQKIQPIETESQKCRICGCDDMHACEGGCYWVEEDLCSECARKLVEKWFPSDDHWLNQPLIDIDEDNPPIHHKESTSPIAAALKAMIERYELGEIQFKGMDFNEDEGTINIDFIQCE